MYIYADETDVSQYGDTIINLSGERRSGALENGFYLKGGRAGLLLLLLLRLAYVHVLV